MLQAIDRRGTAAQHARHLPQMLHSSGHIRGYLDGARLAHLREPGGQPIDGLTEDESAVLGWLTRGRQTFRRSACSAAKPSATSWSRSAPGDRSPENCPRVLCRQPFEHQQAPGAQSLEGPEDDEPRRVARGATQQRATEKHRDRNDGQRAAAARVRQLAIQQVVALEVTLHAATTQETCDRPPGSLAMRGRAVLTMFCSNAAKTMTAAPPPRPAATAYRDRGRLARLIGAIAGWSHGKSDRAQPSSAWSLPGSSELKRRLIFGSTLRPRCRTDLCATLSRMMSIASVRRSHRSRHFGHVPVAACSLSASPDPTPRKIRPGLRCLNDANVGRVISQVGQVTFPSAGAVRAPIAATLTHAEPEFASLSCHS
jgi:hypothetical protein